MRYTVYTITDIRSNKVVYVGETNDFKRRSREHLSLKAHTRDSLYAIGVENILITPIAEFDSRDEALMFEDKMILKYNTIQDGFNKNRSGLIEVSDVNAYKKQYQDEHKSDIAVYQKRYYQENKKHIVEQTKRYYEAHSADISEQKKRYQKQYYQEHREQVNRYRDENKEHIAEQKKQHYQENRDKILGHQKQYYENNRDKILVQKKRYREEHKQQRSEYDKIRYQKKKADKQLQFDISNTPNGHLIQLTIPF